MRSYFTGKIHRTEGRTLSIDDPVTGFLQLYVRYGQGAKIQARARVARRVKEADCGR